MGINREYCSQLRFATDIHIIVFDNTSFKLQQLQQEFVDEREIQGMKINNSKTKDISENDSRVHISTTQIEKVKGHGRK